ncbi:retrovirus-related Pol polyprotein from transposon 412 [Trichonephila clavipes]|nr:retrovirus-related Pol polyprotein from transposon 412 [Trichonephila clavipes]
MNHLKPLSTSTHGLSKIFVHPKLDDCSHVFLRVDKVSPSLSQPYTGPHEVLSRNDKHITININGKKSCVSLDRVKPAFVFKDLPETIPDPIISAESSHRHPVTTNMQTTKSGRRLTSMKIYIRRLQIICNEKEKTVSLLRQDKGHDESDTLYQLAWNEYQDVQSSLQQAVSDFDSLPLRNFQHKRKDDDDFEFPPIRKTARKTILQDSDEIGIENQFSLLPNVIIKQQVSGQLAPPTANISEPAASANQKNGSNALPPPLMLKTDENYRVQTLAHLNITVDGYNGRGVTQCFSCNNFHHNADNCYLKPRCLKCGEEHLTKDCPIKQRLETKFCINCQVYGHMANWYGCPCFPKPPKGTAKINRNSYTNLYNSLIRPNLPMHKLPPENQKITNKNPQQMAPRRPETSRQTETVVQAPPIINRNVNLKLALLEQIMKTKLSLTLILTIIIVISKHCFQLQCNV